MLNKKPLAWALRGSSRGWASAAAGAPVPPSTNAPDLHGPSPAAWSYLPAPSNFAAAVRSHHVRPF